MAEKALSSYLYEEYLALEASSLTKYEFHGGYITAMAGGTLAHGQIAVNVGTSISSEITKNGKPCNSYSSDVKVRIDSTDRTFYPDFSVVCGEVQTAENDSNALINPILILEVLSDSTVAFDRGAKFSHYREITSLKEYILVSQQEAMVDIFFRTKDGTWEIHTYTDLEESIPLKSLECTIHMRDIYRRVPGIDKGM